MAGKVLFMFQTYFFARNVQITAYIITIPSFKVIFGPNPSEIGGLIYADVGHFLSYLLVSFLGPPSSEYSLWVLD